MNGQFSLRGVFDNVEKCISEMEQECEATYEWMVEYGEYAKEYVRNGVTIRRLPKTPKIRKSIVGRESGTSESRRSISVLANPLKRPSCGKSRRKSSKLLNASSISSHPGPSEPAVGVLVDLSDPESHKDTSNVPNLSTGSTASNDGKVAETKKTSRAKKGNEDNSVLCIQEAPVPKPPRRTKRSKLTANSNSDVDSSSSSSLQSVADSKRPQRKKKVVEAKKQKIDGPSAASVRDEVESAEDVDSDKTETLDSNEPTGERRPSIIGDKCVTPKRSPGITLPIQGARKLVENRVESISLDKNEGKENLKVMPASPIEAKKLLRSYPSSSGKKYVPARQIFSPYGVDSIKKKAEAYENHVAKVSTPNDNSKPKRSSIARKRISSQVAPNDKLIFAKAAKMSETQRRSSLTRYHLRIGKNQVLRKLSLEKRRSSVSKTSSENPIEEHPDLKRASNSIDKNEPQAKRLDLQPLVVVEKLDPKSLPGCSSNSTEADAITSAKQSVDNNIPVVVIERLGEDVIAKHLSTSSRNVFSDSSSEGDDDSDSYISADDERDEVSQGLSTPVAEHFNNKKTSVPSNFLQSAIKKIFPKVTNYGSEPRAGFRSRLAYAASLLNASGPARGSAGSVGRIATTSFLKTFRPPSLVLLQKKNERLTEELNRKKLKEEMALKRREQLLKERVLSQKKKLDEKMQKVAVNRLQREREQQDKSRALELQLQQAEEKKRDRAEKQKETMEQKRLQRAKREAEIEERRKQEETAKLAKAKEQEMKLQELEHLKSLVLSQQKSDLQKKAILNSTITKVQQASSLEDDTSSASPPSPNQTYSISDNNYEITPHRSELSVEELKDPENYDIDDLKSGDETDDEEDPRKRIPDWAQGNPLKVAILRQTHHPPDIDELFPQMPEFDLAQVFQKTKQKRRMLQRTSSAIWSSPPLMENS